MAGHNKWSKVKHQSGALETKRGKLFCRLFREEAIHVPQTRVTLGAPPATQQALRPSGAHNAYEHHHNRQNVFPNPDVSDQLLETVEP